MGTAVKGLTITTRAPRLKKRRLQYGTLGGGRFFGVPWWGWLLGASGLGVVALLIFKRKDIGLLASKVVTAGKEAAFAAVLPSGVSSYASELLASANRYGLSPWMLAGIMYRESQGGLAKGYEPKGSPRGTGDRIPRGSGSVYFKFANPATGLPPDGLGWGRGVMQIDYGAHNAWVTSNDWGNAQKNIDYAASIVANNARFFQAAPGGPITVEAWRLKGLTSPSGQVVVKGWADKYGLKSTGPFRDPRPLSGDKLIEATLAAYNAGSKGVLQAIAAGLPASAATAGNDYADWIIARATSWASKFA